MMYHSNKRHTGTTKVNILPEKEGSLTWVKYEVGVLSLLISLFVRLLPDYLLVMAEIPQIFALNVVLSTTMAIWVLFVLRTKHK